MNFCSRNKLVFKENKLLFFDSFVLLILMVIIFIVLMFIYMMKVNLNDSWILVVWFQNHSFWFFRICTLRIVKLELTRLLEQDLTELVISVSMRVCLLLWGIDDKSPFLLINVGISISILSIQKPFFYVSFSPTVSIFIFTHTLQYELCRIDVNLSKEVCVSSL